MPIKNISHLREFVCEQLQNLCDGIIKPEQANSCAMLAANVLLSAKLEMEYSKFMEQKRPIKFMEINDGKERKLIENNSKS